MNALICGAGKYTRNLLTRLGERWHITLIDIAEQPLAGLAQLFPTIAKSMHGDASSPVFLEKAGIDNMDYVLALTGSDEVNLAAARFAKEKGVPHVLTFVHDPEMEPRFLEINAHTLLPAATVANNLYHYLQDPRIRVFPVAYGQGEMVEVEVTRDNWIAGMSINVLEDPEWRMAGFFREDRMFSPLQDEILKEGDRLILLGKRNFFRSVCSLLACAHMPFPMMWGRSLLMVLNRNGDEDTGRVIKEAMYLAGNTRISHVTLFRGEAVSEVDEQVLKWSSSHDIRIRETDNNPLNEIENVCRDENAGLVVIRPLEKSFLRSLTKAEMIELAHALPCPLLVSRGSAPYERILVPFTATPTSEIALETAIELAGLLNAGVDAAVVAEPEFLHNEEEADAPETLFKRVRELSHIHKATVGEVVREGNPVKELTALAADYDLMIVGSTRRDKELLTPHIGELLAERTTCSVLIITGEGA